MLWMIGYTVVCVLCFAWFVWMAERAPEGYEDATGFHLRNKESNRWNRRNTDGR